MSTSESWWLLFWVTAFLLLGTVVFGAIIYATSVAAGWMARRTLRLPGGAGEGDPEHGAKTSKPCDGCISRFELLQHRVVELERDIWDRPPTLAPDVLKALIDSLSEDLERMSEVTWAQAEERGIDRNRLESFMRRYEEHTGDVLPSSYGPPTLISYTGMEEESGALPEGCSGPASVVVLDIQCPIDGQDMHEIHAGTGFVQAQAHCATLVDTRR